MEKNFIEKYFQNITNFGFAKKNKKIANNIQSHLSYINPKVLAKHVDITEC